jgi:hypothetical protein
VTEVSGEALAKRRELAIRVTVDSEHSSCEGRDDVGRDVFRDGMGVLVDVERYRHVKVWRAIGFAAAKVVPDG